MHDAVSRMLQKYERRNLDGDLQAIREIMQEIALLGLWRSKFFDKAAFYGGTALRILYGLDRFSEDLDFSLLQSAENFDLSRYTSSLADELNGFNFDVRVETVTKSFETNIQSAFIKADTITQLLVIETGEEVARSIPRGQQIKVKVEVDTNPPPGFDTHTRYLLSPVPFAVRTYVLPDLFAGKMHALLCRKWKNRVKGRDWYDLVWYAANHPQLHLAHIEQRMRQTGHWSGDKALSPSAFSDLLNESIDRLDVDQARRDVAPFVKDQQMLSIWSHDFFRDVAGRILFVDDSRHS
jgi:predicted nucleotidyltransferase component of viral defense system